MKIQCGLAIRRADSAEAFTLKIRAHDLCNLILVFSDEYQRVHLFLPSVVAPP